MNKLTVVPPPPDPVALRNALRTGARAWLKAYDQEQAAKAASHAAAEEHLRRIKDRSAWSDRLKKVVADLGEPVVVRIGKRAVEVKHYGVAVSDVVLTDTPDVEVV